MTTPATPALPQNNAPEVKPDGGVLGQAAIGALAGASAKPTTSVYQQLTSDPEFLNLDDTNKSYVLAHKDPDFAKLDPASQNQVVTHIGNVAKYAAQEKLPYSVAENHLKAIRPWQIAEAQGDESQVPKEFQYHENPIAAPFIGVMKGEGQTVSGLARLAEKVPGIADIPFVKKMAEAGETGDFETHGMGEAVGNIGENILEFFAGDEALKGLGVADRLAHASKFAKMLEDSPRLAKAVDWGIRALKSTGGDLAATALRQGAVGAGQTIAKGGTGGQAAEVGGVTSGISAVTGGLGAGMAAIYKSIASRSPEALAEALNLAKMDGERVADQIAGGPVESQGGVGVKEALAKADDQMHADFAQGMYNISQQVPDLVINISGTPLQQTANDILGDVGGMPPEVTKALKNVVPEMSRLEPLLRTLGAGAETGQGYQFTWDQMLEIREGLGRTIRRLPYENPIRTDLVNLRGAIDDTIQSAVDKAGVPDVAKELQSIRSVYATQKEAFDLTAIKKLATSDPDSAAQVLFNTADKIKNANELRGLIGNQNMHRVEGQMLKKMIADSSRGGEHANELDPRQFLKKFNSLGPKVQEAFWGDSLPQVKEFLNTVQNLPNASIGWNSLARYLEHRATYGLAEDVLLGTAIGGGIGLSRLPHALAANGIIIGSLLLLHNPTLLKAATSILQKGMRAAPAGVEGVMQQQTTGAQKPESVQPPQQNQPIAENGLEVPEGYSHVRTSEGSEFYIPNEHVGRAREIDTGLKLLNQAGQNSA